MTPRKIMMLFIPGPALAAFVPLWISVAWIAARALPHMPEGVLPLMLAGGPIAALWWSVHRAAASLRRGPQKVARNHTGVG
jgi:hypothetical protein